jgi:hypothetical protein
MAFAQHGQIDLAAIMGGAAPQQALVPQQVLPAAQPEKKKPSVTMAQKRVALMLDILQGKDTFGLSYDKLLLDMAPVDVQKLATYVKLVYGLA